MHHFSPHLRILAERGTRLFDHEDLTRDLFIALGSCGRALRDRAQKSQEEMQRELLHHGPCARVTGTGHSLLLGEGVVDLLMMC